MVATRAQASVAAVRPAAQLDRLPVDLLAHIALYTGYNDEDGCHGGDDKSDLLALRCACRACEPAVRRAARDHELLKYCYFRSGGGYSVAGEGTAPHPVWKVGPCTMLGPPGTLPKSHAPPPTLI